MMTPKVIHYKMEYDEKTKIYTGYCPSMKAVRFSANDENTVKELVEDGVKLFLNKNPKFFENFNDFEV